MKWATTRLIRVGVVPVLLGLTLVITVQLAPARVDASSPLLVPVDPSKILPLLPVLTPAPLPLPATVTLPLPVPDVLYELTLRIDEMPKLADQLIDSGASRADAFRAIELLRARIGQSLSTGTDLKLGLGSETANGGRAIEYLSLITDVGMERIERRQGVLTLATSPATRSVSVTVETGSYWSLRAAGLAPELAAEAADLAEKRLGALPRATIKVIFGERPARFGSVTSPVLLVVAVERIGRPTRRLMAWPVGAKSWIDPDRIAPWRTGLGRPVAGKVTSGFGARFHPILLFFRAHRGVDFAARSGEPVRAVADGCVTGAGWSGGYGRQVRLAHYDRSSSSYSHLSSTAVDAGQCIRRGGVIGLAGASGLATGPHLHFELYRAGQAVDPLRYIGGATVDVARRSAIAARLARIESGSRS